MPRAVGLMAGFSALMTPFFGLFLQALMPPLFAVLAVFAVVAFLFAIRFREATYDHHAWNVIGAVLGILGLVSAVMALALPVIASL